MLPCDSKEEGCVRTASRSCKRSRRALSVMAWVSMAFAAGCAAITYWSRCCDEGGANGRKTEVIAAKQGVAGLAKSARLDVGCLKICLGGIDSGLHVDSYPSIYEALPLSALLPSLFASPSIRDCTRSYQSLRTRRTRPRQKIVHQHTNAGSRHNRRDG